MSFFPTKAERGMAHLKKAVDLLGPVKLAELVIAQAVPEGEPCPLGCTGEIEDLQKRLAEAENANVEVRAEIRAVRDAHDGLLRVIASTLAVRAGRP